MHSGNPQLPDSTAVAEAANRIAPYVWQTPVLRQPDLDRALGAQLYFKCENLQRGGAFKLRGACNAVLQLGTEALRRGVVTHSSGNHGIAVATAAALHQVPAHVVVPDNAPLGKRSQIEALGARVVTCAPSLAAREACCAQLIADSGGVLIHPYDDAQVIAGQGTAARELLLEVEALDTLVAPVSGGGLLSGTMLAARSVAPGIQVLGAEPEQAADAHESLRQGRRITDLQPNTLCDGLRASLGAIPFALLHEARTEILLASEAQIVAAMRLLWDRLKMTVEPSSSVTLAALLRQGERFKGRRIGVILSGGNVDLDRLPWQEAPVYWQR